MVIHQLEDKNLSHFSYAILSECEKKIVLIDPARNTQPYFDFAKKYEAEIISVIETHPHADFASSHLEIHKKTGATIYTSKLVNALYQHQTFDEGDIIGIGKIKLTAINTPGHSPDSICILLEHEGKEKAVFTGDTLFIGDCGRPDLREGAGNLQATRHELAKQMYYSLRNKLMVLNDDVLVYPAHGAGTLCGKALSSAHSSTIGTEKKTNWSLQEMSEEEFVENLLTDQPFVPAYFPYDVEMNRKGNTDFEESINKVKIGKEINEKSDTNFLNKKYWVIDARDEKEFKKQSLPHSINLMEGTKFETWLGSIIKPGEKFYLAGHSTAQLKKLVERTAAIAYEGFIEEAFVLKYGEEKMDILDKEKFKKQTSDYTIVDVRNPSEIKEKKIFNNSLSIPLADLTEQAHKLPVDKPIVVHCAGGYRSAAASSLIKSAIKNKVAVYDLGESIKEFS